MTSRRDYIVVAKMVLEIADRDIARKVANVLAEIFSNDNPRFDWSRFMSACGFGSGDE